MCDSRHHIFLCEMLRVWPHEIIKTSKSQVKIYKQLELIRKDKVKLAVNIKFCLLYNDTDQNYPLYVLYENKVQCSWICHDITGQFKTLVKSDTTSGESKETEKKIVKLCALEYEWLNFDRIIGKMSGYPEDMYGDEIFSKTFESRVLLENMVNLKQIGLDLQLI